MRNKIMKIFRRHPTILAGIVGILLAGFVSILLPHIAPVLIPTVGCFAAILICVDCILGA